MATRLVTMGRLLKDRDLVLPLDQRQEAPLAAKAELDVALNDLRAAALGEVGGAAVAAYEALLPDDGGAARGLGEPQHIERFAATFFSWSGGSNFIDDPRVRVERRAGEGWVEHADMSGEVPVTLQFPAHDEALDFLAGEHEWRWTAHFEAFAAPFDTGERPRATPAGTYRFVVDGRRMQDGQPTDYRIVSEPFEVTPWSGIEVSDPRAEGDGRVSFALGPRTVRTSGAVSEEIGPIDYPDSYEGPARFIDLDWEHKGAPPPDGEWFCFTCTFRPWLDTGEVAAGWVTVVSRACKSRRVHAVADGERLRTLRPVKGAAAFVAAGDVRDTFGNLNGEASETLELAGGCG